MFIFKGDYYRSPLFFSMNTRIFLIFLSLLSFAACKKENRNEPPKVVSYNISTIIGSNTHLKYYYNDQGLLSRVDGKDRDKSLTCDITYDKDRVYIYYENRTAGEIWNITLEVDSTTGYIQRFDDGMYLATFVYDAAGFSDGKQRLVASYYHDGKYKGDSLCYNMKYDAMGNLISFTYRGEDRRYEYYDDEEEEETSISTLYTEAVLGRFERIISYLPYTFGPPQKSLVRTKVRSEAFYTNYSYKKDEFGRIVTIYENAAGTDYYYLGD